MHRPMSLIILTILLHLSNQVFACEGGHRKGSHGLPAGVHQVWEAIVAPAGVNLAVRCGGFKVTTGPAGLVAARTNEKAPEWAVKKMLSIFESEKEPWQLHPRGNRFLIVIVDDDTDDTMKADFQLWARGKYKLSHYREIIWIHLDDKIS